MSSNDKLTLRIGIASREAIKRRTIAIAKGEWHPGENEPRVWFSSLESLAKVLSGKNLLLLDIIRQEQPKSFTALSKMSGRAVSNLSRTLHSMERIGLVEIHEDEHRKFPVLRYDRVACDVNLREDDDAKAA
jgi:predicted transcriptional regulator